MLRARSHDPAARQGPAPSSAPSCTPGAPCARRGPSLPAPGGVAGRGGGGAPFPGVLRACLARSCAMALGEELRSGCFWRGVLAEAAATLIFVGVVLGASVAPAPLAPALAGGLVAGALACTLGAPQANPALTLALLCTRKLGALRGAAGLLAQCAGAVLASAAARLALPDDASLVTRVTAAGTAGQALAWETFATFQLALAAFAATDRAAPQGGLALGSAVAAGALAAGPFSGGSMNPARSLGPAVVTGIWDDHWVYWLGPVLGAVLAGLSYEFVFAPSASREKLGACLACRDVALVETTSPSPSSPSARSPPAPPAERGQGTA
ncbi:aquaporin-2-like isoform X1 [Mycteria americana]|uniref:aquaporin-2-like isoform X1 n=1 Tax=Mycteria americana TaxID=33587 RepID=UPI003F586795